MNIRKVLVKQQYEMNNINSNTNIYSTNKFLYLQ